MLDSKASPSQLSIYAVPHPAMRRTAAWIADVLATEPDGLNCAVKIGHDATTCRAERAIYIRPAATDALGLIAAADSLRGACASMASFDAACRDLYCIAWEHLLARPHATLRALAGHFGLRLSQAVGATVDARIAELRADAQAYDHALSFVAGLDVAQPVAAWTDSGLADEFGIQIVRLMDPTVPRTALVVSSEPDQLPALLRQDVTDWQVERVDPSDPTWVERFAGIAPRSLIYLQNIDAQPLVDRLIDQLVPILADGGVLCGMEVSDPAVASVVARLTARGDQHDLIFSLAGASWFAFTPAWRR